MKEFVKENEIKSAHVQAAYQRFENLSSTSSYAPTVPQSFELDFDTWLQVNAVCLLTSSIAVRASSRFPGVLARRLRTRGSCSVPRPTG